MRKFIIKAHNLSGAAETYAHPMSTALPESVLIREVGPRDGFQNEPERIPTDDKVRLIDALARTGLPRIEVTSFVRPEVVPQLSDAAEVLSRVDIPDGVSTAVLVPNRRGLEGALAHRDKVDEVILFLSASESHNRHNVNRSVAESLQAITELLRRHRAGGAAAGGLDLDLVRLPLRGSRRARAGPRARRAARRGGRA